VGFCGVGGGVNAVRRIGLRVLSGLVWRLVCGLSFFVKNSYRSRNFPSVKWPKTFFEQYWGWGWFCLVFAVFCWFGCVFVFGV